MGTTFVIEEEDAPRLGRIILFRYEDGHVQMITEKEVKNVPYAMLPYHGKLLVAIGNSVREFDIIVGFASGCIYIFLDSIV